MKKNNFFSIFSFGQVNYIFRKLLVNTKHVKFRLPMSPWRIFVENGYLAHFSFTFWGAPTYSHVAETAQGLKGKVLWKKFVLFINLGFSFFFHFSFSHGFAWCHLQCDRYDLHVKFLIFFKKFYKVHSVEVLNQDPHQEK